MNTSLNHLFSASLVTCFFALWIPPANADTAAVVAAKSQAAIDAGKTPTWWTPTLPDEIRDHVTNKGRELSERLEFSDKSRAARAATLISDHFGKVWAWHQEVDKRLNAAWADWDAARDNLNGKQKDELRALAIMTERIDPIYAEFTPQIRSVLNALRNEIGEKKTTQLLDHITRSPGAKRTYEAYCAMVPEMTESEKAILWKRMAQAREDSLAAWSQGRIVKIFKKYKTRNEFSIDYFGYGYRKHYQAWAKNK